METPLDCALFAEFQVYTSSRNSRSSSSSSNSIIYNLAATAIIIIFNPTWWFRHQYLSTNVQRTYNRSIPRVHTGRQKEKEASCIVYSGRYGIIYLTSQHSFPYSKKNGAPPQRHTRFHRRSCVSASRYCSMVRQCYQFVYGRLEEKIMDCEI